MFRLAMPSVVKPLHVQWWEAALAVPLFLVVVLFLVAGDFAAAVVLVAVATLILLWRAEIVERNVAGGYARVRGWVLMTQWLAMAAIYAVIVGVFWVAKRDHWSHTTPGVVAVYASAGLAFFLVREMLRRGDKAFDYSVVVRPRSVLRMRLSLFGRWDGTSFTTSGRTRVATWITLSWRQTLRSQSRPKADGRLRELVGKRWRTQHGRKRNTAVRGSTVCCVCSQTRRRQRKRLDTHGLLASTS
jgi:hypothetical protein